MRSADDCQTKLSTESSVESLPSGPTRRPYAGWIPTVNGRLSFRHIGDARRPTESIFANLDTGAERIIVAYQHRPLSDILFPRLIHWLYDISGDFWFALTAKSNNSPLVADWISGKIHIFKSRADWRTSADQAVRSYVHEINALRFSNAADIPAQAHLAFDRARKLVDECADIEVDFDLDRNGEVYFGNPVFREQALQRASEEFAANGGHNIRKWVADQCYFFLRDLSHAHQQHESSSDTILILQDRRSDDIQWRKNIIYSLQYAIIRFKRDPDARSTLRAMGILAYCNSFTACCEAKLQQQFSGFPKFNNDALLLSLQAKADEISTAEQIISNRQNGELAKVVASRTIALAFVAILVATIAILIQPRISSQEKEEFALLYRVSTFAAENFFSFLGLSGVTLLVTWVATAFNLRVANRRLARSLLEASYVRTRGAIAVFFLGALVVSGFTVWLFWPAMSSMLETMFELFQLFRTPAK
ncbi:hypothetical protein OZ411_18290 [Bradyrhizobium sp. Arg237L]|uniref:hypothetical protein n=1 Tax=Bradyrhizobium sp. Arg237L TaxID=3003352 RepID=UPI00249EBD83|nr:hypothetical protein [Bradyrhizobium sp. Arg237L]MDI4234756.1 hypothetical protein [Bradyrhizobium sp. Arg237L]